MDLGLSTTSTLAAVGMGVAVLAYQSGQITRSRTYAKGVVEGGSEVTLTPEEQQALAAARIGKGPE